MSYFLKTAAGFDVLADGPIITNWPWATHTVVAIPNVVDGEGAFGGKALQLAKHATLYMGATLSFPSTAMVQRNNTNPEGKSMWGIGFWIKVTDVDVINNGSPLLSLTHSSTPTVATSVPLVGVRNTVAAGLELVFPSTTANIATSPYTMSIGANEYYWVNIKLVLYPNAQYRATYSINNVEIQTNIPITMSADHLGTTPDRVANRIGFNTCLVGQAYIDDLVIQTVSGADEDWPAGGGGTNPGNPFINQMPSLTPRRIRAVELGSNGSVNEWQPSDPEMENYKAVQSTDAFVESLSSGETDLYKLKMDSVPVNDCIGVVTSFGSNRYLNVEPVMKGSDTADIVEPKIVTGGLRRVQSVQETDLDGNKWNKASLTALEIGQRSR